MCLCFILFLTQKLNDKKTVSDNVTQGVTLFSFSTILHHSQDLALKWSGQTERGVMCLTKSKQSLINNSSVNSRLGV